MANYDPNSAARLKHLADLASRTKTALDAIDTKYNGAFQSLSVSGTTVSFFTSKDASGTAAFTFDFPEEIFLDQASTQLVENFAWSAATYPNTTNPNLDGKTVLVLGIKGDKETNPTTKFSFVNLEKLIDVYESGDNVINIAGYTVTVKISAAVGNIIEAKSDGLYATAKVAGAVNGNVAGFGADGLIVDGGISLADVDASNKIDKVTNAVQGNFAIWGASGVLVDSGVTFATDADVTAMLDEYFPQGGTSNSGN